MPETSQFSPEGLSPWEQPKLNEGLTTRDTKDARQRLSEVEHLPKVEPSETIRPDATEGKSPFEHHPNTYTGTTERQNLLDPLLQAEQYQKEQEKLSQVRDVIKNISKSGEPVIAESIPAADRGDAPVRDGQPNIIVEGISPDQEFTDRIDTSSLEQTMEEVTERQIDEITQEEITIPGVEGIDEQTIDINPETAEDTFEQTPSDLETTLENLPANASTLSPEDLSRRLPEEGGDEESPTLR